MNLKGQKAVMFYVWHLPSSLNVRSPSAELKSKIHFQDKFNYVEWEVRHETLLAVLKTMGLCIHIEYKKV